MTPILAGIETEYGLLIEGRTPEDQVDDAAALVRSYPDECLAVWDASDESPRTDLRGFQVERLAHDPVDARFDEGRPPEPIAVVRADRILPNGARFYNDHGHPEYATPECWSDHELALHDRAGERAVLAAAHAYAGETGKVVRVYKNNTDYHGASYGTHESYLVPRMPFEPLFAALTPMLVARTLLCGAGKVGSESGAPVEFQLSQRADFFTEAASVDTLYRRPVFNTRDEPHADAKVWMRVHVISGDANMSIPATECKIGLAKLALALLIEGACPTWKLADSAGAMRSVSRGLGSGFEIQLDGGGTSNAEEVLLSYLDAGDRVFGDEGRAARASWRRLLADREGCPERFAAHVDWAAKKRMLDEYRASEGVAWTDPWVRAFDLEYHNVDPEASLFYGLQAIGRVSPDPEPETLARCLRHPPSDSRAAARGAAIHRFRDDVVTASWRTLTLRVGGGVQTVELHPDMRPSQAFEAASDVESFMTLLRGGR
ncbi:MAG: proteasome accessory factor PafA2 family protein [Fimbriimonadaceae bacterium]|nr:proteasome accessory factor PafA2 family protein [Chthonomonadaceae bacterium]MCO5295820.1 proteasome accessory factor PafA2 family protein [Fimbriimonadaceae bacterium]